MLNLDNSKNRRLVELCYRTSKVLLNPIVDWSDEDVWEYLHYYGCRSNPLYEAKEKNGTYIPTAKKRIGCIGCPMARACDRKKELYEMPKYRDAYLRAFDKMLKAREAAGLNNGRKWRDAEAVLMWWLEDDPDQVLFEKPAYLPQ